jgi:pyruvate,orthophosphate dikinase
MVAEVYLFDEVPKDALTKSVLGGKGRELVEMTKLGLQVPPGIIITTKMCNEFFRRGKEIWPELKESILKKVELLEKRVGKRFADVSNPLLVSVRSGAPFSMPGMMDTILNLGINDEIAEMLAKKSEDNGFAYDTYRRFIQLFGKIVMGVPGEKFEKVLEKIKEEVGARTDLDVKADEWKEVVKRYKQLIQKETGKELPQDPLEQLLMSVAAVFNSWWNPRAITYRKIYKLPDSLGTAVNIVMMVYGNLDDKSGTGVAFTRNPSTGENKLYGEFLMKAQGEDVVAGVRTPFEISKLNEMFPKIYRQLEEISKILEKHFRDMQDVEFTIESGKLYMLQTRTGKRTAIASVKIAIDMEKEGLITKQEAVLRIETDQLQRLLYKQINPKVKEEPIAKGLPASPGAAVGKVVFRIDEAQRAKQKGEKIILVRPETTPEDIVGIAASNGLLTSKGGMTSHAAVVTRGMGKPCIVGAEEIRVNVEKGVFVVKGKEIRAGDVITIDGDNGLVYSGKMTLIDPTLTSHVMTVLEWADSFRRLGVRANADTPEMAIKAKENGAEGIGLVRTERMFNAPDKLDLVQKMVLADSSEERKKYLDIMKLMQKSDFKEIFKIMNGLPVTIRLLDLPLHEFLPKLEEILTQVLELRASGKNAKELKDKERILSRAMALKEYNPMMGQRGVRLALVYTEIYRMQVDAIFEAAIELFRETGNAPKIEIMISQVAAAEEFRKAKEIVEKEAEEVMKARKTKLEYRVGSMIETPRAALTAFEIAIYADFFSFGTNDLTQATFAFSRDDVETEFMPFYMENNVLESNPFETLDNSGVGRLVVIGATEGKRANPKLRIGICGEHGGDPKSIEFFSTTEVDYVSCSPYRVPVARLAAAQAELKKSYKASTTV